MTILASMVMSGTDDDPIRDEHVRDVVPEFFSYVEVGLRHGSSFSGADSVVWHYRDG